MPGVILQISYEIDEQRREDYLRLVKEMKEHFTAVRGKQYSVYELRGKPNSFVEQFVCGSVEEYEALDDNLDEKSEELVNRLETLLKNGKARYQTLVEPG
ncbi:MAG: hypothetical protein FJ215_03790 [Ignavibacteria bacterium]|nr:hypothetical protein [Ignavibacteria bacterium]